MSLDDEKGFFPHFTEDELRAMPEPPKAHKPIDEFTAELVEEVFGVGAEPERQDTIGLGVPTPECDRLLAVADESQRIGAFLDWMKQQGIQFCRYNRWGKLEPIRENIEGILAQHYGIDLRKVEAERAALLDAYRNYVKGKG